MRTQPVMACLGLLALAACTDRTSGSYGYNPTRTTIAGGTSDRDSNSGADHGSPGSGGSGASGAGAGAAGSGGGSAGAGTGGGAAGSSGGSGSGGSGR